MSSQSDAGFTLIEALVAMAVLALGAVSLLSAAEGHTKHITDLTQRIAARWAAEYQLSQVRLNLPLEAQNVSFYGIAFDVTGERQPTQDPDVEKVTVRTAQAGSDRTLYILDGYIDIGGAP
jgi:general secretion pathway protein I